MNRGALPGRKPTRSLPSAREACRPTLTPPTSNAPTANIFAILTSVARTPEFHHRAKVRWTGEEYVSVAAGMGWASTSHRGPTKPPALVENRGEMTGTFEAKVQRLRRSKHLYGRRREQQRSHLWTISGFEVRVPDGAPLLLFSGPSALVVPDFWARIPGYPSGFGFPRGSDANHGSLTTSGAARGSVAMGADEYRGVS